MTEEREVVQALESKEMAVITAGQPWEYKHFLNDNLSCAICNEYYIQAVRLNCKHVFCRLCIDKWRKVATMCPVCRETMSYYVTLPAVDTIVDNMISQLTLDNQNERKALVRQRTVEDLTFNGRHLALSALILKENVLKAGGEAVGKVSSAAQTGAVTARRLYKAATLKTTRTLTKLKQVTREDLMKAIHSDVLPACSKQIRRAQAFLAAAAASAGQLNRAEVMRKAASLVKAMTSTAAKRLGQSAVLRRAAELTDMAIQNVSKAVSKMELKKKAITLVKALMDSRVGKIAKYLVGQGSKAVVGTAKMIKDQAMKNETVRKTADTLKTYAVASKILAEMYMKGQVLDMDISLKKSSVAKTKPVLTVVAGNASLTISNKRIVYTNGSVSRVLEISTPNETTRVKTAGDGLEEPNLDIGA